MPQNPKISSKQKDRNKDDAPRLFRAPRGMKDVLPQEQPYWEKIESAIKDAAKFYNFSKIDTPVLEFADLFKRTSGEESDVVAKEMYIIKTKGEDVLALRPEFTAPKARAYMEHSLSRIGQPQKLWNIGPVFRHDRPQLGRFRQFTQADFDILGGVNDPICDAQIILILHGILKELKIGETILKVNSIGCRVCRPIYLKQLVGFYGNRKKQLCENCAKRLETNPLRLLDCKNDGCRKLRSNAPNFLDKICATCSSHLKSVLEYLDELKIFYELNYWLVRGLDYYSRTVFEIFASGRGGEIGAIAAGGRYDYLMEAIGGHLTPAVGGSLGVERIISVMKENGIKPPARTTKSVFVAHAGESAKKKALKLVADLRAEDIPVAEALSKDSLKAQLKIANKERISVALILGQKEIYDSSVIIRDMRTGLQDCVRLDKIVVEIKKRWKQ